MKTLAELDLPHLPMEEPAFGQDPLRYLIPLSESSYRESYER